jgi:hypothetical protein
MTDKYTTVLLASDTHINSTVALCPPKVDRDDGGTYHASRTQRAMWENWLDFWGQDWPGRKVAILNGDIGELDPKHYSSQLITRNKQEIFYANLETLEPVYNTCEKVVFVRGTPAHSGAAGEWEETLASDCSIAVKKSKKVASWFHFQGTIDGVRFDAAHHCNMGRLPWTRANSANKLAKLALDHYVIDLEQKPPDVVLRAHHHRYADSGDNFPVWAVCMPAWSSLTEYAHRIGGELSLGDIGGVVIVIKNGEIVQKKKLVYKPKASRIWALKV